VLENLIRRSRIIEYHDVDDNSAGASNANVDTSPNTKLHHSQMSGANGEEIYPLYKKGKATNVFSLVLSGKVIVRAGVERFESDLGPWSFLGSNSMVQPAYVPDFDADAIRPFRILQISRSDFLAATRATLVRHKTLDAKQRRRLSKQQASGASAAPAMASNASTRATSRSLGEHDGVGASDVRIEESDDEGLERHAVYDQDGQRQHRSSSDGHLNNRRTRASSGEYLSSIDVPQFHLVEGHEPEREAREERGAAYESAGTRKARPQRERQERSIARARRDEQTGTEGRESVPLGKALLDASEDAATAVDACLHRTARARTSPHTPLR